MNVIVNGIPSEGEIEDLIQDALNEASLQWHNDVIDGTNDASPARQYVRRVIELMGAVEARLEPRDI